MEISFIVNEESEMWLIKNNNRWVIHRSGEHYAAFYSNGDKYYYRYGSMSGFGFDQR